MFPSSGKCNNPFESLVRIRSSPSDENLTPKHDDDLLFNFPSPFLDDNQSPLNQIFLQNSCRLSGGKSKIEDEIRSGGAGPPRRRRAGKKDRHSKICTAQGIRDRRMRLSLQVARKFFDLQDMLGYDKASKTIEWLFTQSNKAIKELVHRSPPPNNNESECEEEINAAITITTPKPHAKASREKARARARWRTTEKMLLKRLPNPNYDIPPFQEPNPYLGIIHNFFGNSISCPTSDYHCSAADSSFMPTFGNWDLFSNDRSNCFHYSLVNQVSFTAANLNSVAEFP